MKAYIHTVGGAPFNEECSSAWKGFESLGVEVVPFSNNEQLEPAEHCDVVVGGMMVCEHALARFGAEPPVIDYPMSLSKYYGRRIRITTARSIGQNDLPLFVKPVKEKDLPGSVVYSKQELAPYLAKGESYALYASDPIRLVSEWRIFVRFGRIVGIRHYGGAADAHPDFVLAAEAANDYVDAPAGYAMDFGVTEDGRTVLIEVNDGFALGCYGLDATAYALLLLARWCELSGASCPHRWGHDFPKGNPLELSLGSETRKSATHKLLAREVPPSEAQLACARQFDAILVGHEDSLFFREGSDIGSVDDLRLAKSSLDQDDFVLLRRLKADCLEQQDPPFGINTLATSENYIVYAIFDYAYLFFRNASRGDVFLGWFYGDPEGALIDREERFCTVFSNGIIVYRLEEPFAPYDGAQAHILQWDDFDRTNVEWVSTHCDQVRFITTCRQQEDGLLEYADDEGKTIVYGQEIGFREAG